MPSGPFLTEPVNREDAIAGIAEELAEEAIEYLGMNELIDDKVADGTHNRKRDALKSKLASEFVKVINKAL